MIPPLRLNALEKIYNRYFIIPGRSFPQVEKFKASYKQRCVEIIPRGVERWKNWGLILFIHSLVGISTAPNADLTAFSKVIHRLVDNFTHRGGISQKPLDKAVDKSTPQKEIHNAVDYLWKTVKGNLFFSPTWRFLPSQKYAILQKYV
ncbi:hypothetical protein DWW61_07755 [Limosilactobacillus fermentum]|jgi:hypothetical protein|uniref:Uncharacterized protein n=2 Tax=Limosilactobacillus fermentum TaxID=1613 RepID=A0A2K2THH5_LIMFE|nr:hypothetical protein BKD34_09070 [Limosilactobacillus fermentum]EEI22801.1 hypothetical protein HMPREF0511_0238 [Limosilactobacillus fermentum ATCC 14931]CDI68280.1 Putative uncharacterized protein [Limosilactobacillus fermentum L930BB]AUO28547.1 L-ascorbate 6-phosphate lactonase [Limosilactobacillus fermentum]AWV31098.1 hypothetical protein CD188_10280 [Limosilactobacillus fermentum]